MSRTAKNADVPAITPEYFDYSKCKYHNVEMLESEYLQAKMSNTMQTLLMKGYVFPIKTRGGRILFKEWSFRNASYIDKHLSKEQRNPNISITTRPKVIIKLKYSEPGSWVAISPKELIEYMIKDCEKRKLKITAKHKEGWQELLDTCTFLKHND